MPPVLVASATDVVRLLSTSRAIEAMYAAFRAWGGGTVEQPLRQVLPAPTGAFFVMPATVGSVAGVKAITYLPGNARGPLPVIQGLVTLFDMESGRPLAIIDAASLTAIRTAAASGLATRHMARDDAHVLAILGAGVQAHTHLSAMRDVRDVREIRVWSRTGERARAFALDVERVHHLSVRVCDSAKAAVAGADIVCCVTSSHTPVLASADLADGAHVNAVGAHTPTTRELDSATIARSRLIVDSRVSAMAEGGELLLAIADGTVTAAHLAGELTDVVLGRVAGRTSAHELTIFKSLGIAIEDVSAAAAVLEAARVDPGATWIDL